MLSELRRRLNSPHWQNSFLNEAQGSVCGICCIHTAEGWVFQRAPQPVSNKTWVTICETAEFYYPTMILFATAALYCGILLSKLCKMHRSYMPFPCNFNQVQWHCLEISHVHFLPYYYQLVNLRPPDLCRIQIFPVLHLNPKTVCPRSQSPVKRRYRAGSRTTSSVHITLQLDTVACSMCYWRSPWKYLNWIKCVQMKRVIKQDTFLWVMLCAASALLNQAEHCGPFLLAFPTPYPEITE